MMLKREMNSADLCGRLRQIRIDLHGEAGFEAMAVALSIPEHLA
jgi:hypothetical protein